MVPKINVEIMKTIDGRELQKKKKKKRKKERKTNNDRMEQGEQKLQ